MFKSDKLLLAFIILIATIFSSLVINFGKENFNPKYNKELIGHPLSDYCPSGCIFHGVEPNRPSGYECRDIYGYCPGPEYGCCRYDYECQNC